MHKAWHGIEEVPYCFLRSFIKFPDHMGPKINDLNPILSKNIRPVAAIKSLRFALLLENLSHFQWEIDKISGFILQCTIKILIT